MMRKLLSGVAAVALWFSACDLAVGADCSGTIVAGGVAQTVFKSGNVRGLLLMNNSADLMCISINGAPAAMSGANCAVGSWALQPSSAATAGGSFSSPVNVAISSLSIIAATTGDQFSCERQ